MDEALPIPVTRPAVEVVDGIPRFVTTVDADQLQTEQSFAYKWGKRASYESEAMRAVAQEWMLRRYGFESSAAMRAYLAERDPVLDAGCGSGFTSSLWLEPGWSKGKATWLGADVSGAIDVARERLADIERVYFVQADVLDLPFEHQSFGAVVCEGVMHHTPSTEAALHALAGLLRSGGEFLFYVYRRKAPVREFADDHVRAAVSGLPPAEAWEALRPLTELGKLFAELNAEVEVPDIPVLGIEAGTYDVQRLIYWHFAKLFWNHELTMEENLHVNFDWYHPRYAHRHSEEEVRAWCGDADLEITRFDVEPSGFTVRAIKR
jgi:SAM-dependent methyltransferase